MHTLNVNLKFHGGGNFDVFLITIAPTQSLRKGQFEGPWGWKFWYLRTVLQTEGQFEVSWGWEFCYLPTSAHSKVNLKFHGVGNLVSSYWCTHSMSI